MKIALDIGYLDAPGIHLRDALVEQLDHEITRLNYAALALTAESPDLAVKYARMQAEYGFLHAIKKQLTNLKE